MLTVACVLKESETYNQSHVHRLRQQLIGRINQAYNFVCVEDSPYPGWWSKIDLFKPGRFEGRVLYFDLDVTIVSNLDEIIDYAPFAAVRDYLNKNLINSSVMVWNAGELDHLYKRFTLDDMNHYPGDQEYIQDFSLPTKFPKNWFPSYKHSKVTDDAKAIIYHGNPKPWQVES